MKITKINEFSPTNVFFLVFVIEFLFRSFSTKLEFHFIPIVNTLIIYILQQLDRYGPGRKNK